MADKVTLNLKHDTLIRARDAARREGVSLSAWIDRAARREALRVADELEREWLAANPGAREELEVWEEVAAAFDDRWDDLGEPAA